LPIRGNRENEIARFRGLRPPNLAISNPAPPQKQTRVQSLRSCSRATKWFYEAAIQGDAKAQYNLGVMYEKGQGVLQNATNAAMWYRKAARNGHSGAQYNLGVMYQDGQGDSQAQFNVGGMYVKGLGVPQDLVQAYIWLDLSASHGSQRALQLQDTIIQEMTPTQLAEARKLARTHAVPKGGI
jgi:TPR repeat protein